MQERLNYWKAGPEAAKAAMAFETAVRASGLPTTLLTLIRLRASQINGCAYCIAMHTKEARQEGEDQRRLDLLQSWHETTLFDEREQAALLWTETLTRVADTHAPDAAYARLSAAFDERERVMVTLAVAAINTWNRFAIGFRTPPEV